MVNPGSFQLVALLSPGPWRPAFQPEEGQRDWRRPTSSSELNPEDRHSTSIIHHGGTGSHQDARGESLLEIQLRMPPWQLLQPELNDRIVLKDTAWLIKGCGLWLLWWTHLIALHSFPWVHSSPGSFGIDADLAKNPYSWHHHTWFVTSYVSQPRQIRALWDF